MRHNKLLLIAYHFPPIQGSTGTTRTLAFSKYLARQGWEVCILTIDPDAYGDTADENLALVSRDVRVERAWGLDSRRHLAVLGRYPLFLALPDRWQSWILGGFLRGSRIVQEWRPTALMSTYPIPSAHALGFLLCRKFNLPWIAEFRDPMLQPDYPPRALERWAFRKLEERIFARASEIVVTTDGCRSMYLERFPELDSRRVSVIPNGYDPEMFAAAEVAPSRERNPEQTQRTQGKLVLLHSGLLYPEERNPEAFLRALASLQRSGFLDPFGIEFRLRATGNDEYYRNMIERHGLASVVKVAPRVAYVAALEEMLEADALVIFQADNCNDQIPAKVYEYMYCRKPILAFTDPAGETGKLLGRLGVEHVARLEDDRQIEQALEDFLPRLRNGRAFVIPKEAVEQYSRESLSVDLAAVLARAVSR